MKGPDLIAAADAHMSRGTEARGDITITVERDGKELEVNVGVQDGIVWTATLADGTDITLTPDEESDAVEQAWQDTEDTREAHEEDSWDRSAE